MDFIVRTNLFKCFKNHTVEDIAAEVTVVDRKGNIKYPKVQLYKRKDENENICILKFDRSILDFDGVVVSDRNSSNSVFCAI